MPRLTCDDFDIQVQIDEQTGASADTHCMECGMEHRDCTCDDDDHFALHASEYAEYIDPRGYYDDDNGF